VTTTGPNRAPARRRGNRLGEEASLYLRQHAHDPVDWYPWGDAALRRAQAEDRPIFLSSGYASCHWCHVMAHEVFADPAVADTLNRHFVSIKVDREEQPAIDDAYMQAVQLLTGGGGWPMSVFLLPDRRPFFGGTYIPRDRFLALLERIVELWGTRRGELARQAGEITQRILAGPMNDAAPPVALDAALLARVVRAAQDQFDEHYGGFAGPLKFPVPVRWQFLLDWHRRTGDPAARAMVERTLAAMAAGGLRDHVGGGFHRYTVDAAWTVPHFEKMLYDNAQLASLFLAAGAALRRPDFTAVGVDTLEFLAREMSDESGACFASFDADSGGHEGTFYVWTPAQITAAVGTREGPLLADLLGVTAEGNFEAGLSVVTRRTAPAAVAARHRVPQAALDGLFERHRATLRAVRGERTPPGLDRKVVTAWSALTLSAFVRGALATGRAEFREQAGRIADFLWRVHRDPAGRLRRASNAGQAVGDAGLEDHALLAQGLLDLFQLTGEVELLERAHILLVAIRDHFSGPSVGWYTTAAWAEAPLGRRVDRFDSVIPGGASSTVQALITYGALTGRQEVLEEARAQLAAAGHVLDRAGLEMAGWLAAAVRLGGPLRTVIVAGDPEAPDRADLLAAAGSSLSPGVVVAPVAGAGPPPRLGERAPALAGKAAQGGRARAFICREGVCGAAVMDAPALGALATEGWIC